MGLVPRHVIDEIVSRVDLLELAEKYLSLEKSGSNFKGLCPFHSEKTPSFMISPEKQIYHCFGCGAGGNVLKFLMQIENLSFYEAIKRLAQVTGISLKFDEKLMDEETRNAEKKERMKKLLARVTQIYRSQLSQHHDGMNYFLARGLTPETLDRFSLGYAPPSGAVARSSEFTPEQRDLLAEAGVLQGEAADCYEKFSGRVIFPLQNKQGEVIGFGGRIIVEKNAAKYLNSPDSLLFKKGENFYGMLQCAQGIRQKNAALLVEGYLDLITLVQAGVDNVLATLGTALTPHQARTLKRMCRDIFILYDNDEAGIKASLRCGEIFAKEGVLVSIVRIPGAKDPDEFIRKFGPEKLEEVLRKKVSYFEVKLEFLNRGIDLENIIDRKRLYTNLKQVLTEVLEFSELLYEDLLTLWSSEYRVRKELLRIESISIQSEKKLKKILDEPKPMDKIEREVLRMALNFEEYREKLKSLGSQSEDFFKDESLKEITRQIISSDNRAGWMRELSEKAVQTFTELTFSPPTGLESSDYWMGHISKLEQRLKNEQLKNIRQKISQAEEAGDYEAVQKWQELYLKLSKNLQPNG
ncbi:MAG: DNA primase [Candidatus Wallbacteria bacterium]|nr:DNA primase [Candidatus Wallbacteria bacterium]